MRIARIVQYFQPRFGYADYYIMTKFKKLGHKVCIITSDRYSPNVTLFHNSINRKIGSKKSVEYGLTVYRLPTSFEMDGLIINLIGIKKVLEDFQPDIIHSNDLFYSVTCLAGYYKKKFRYNLFVDSITGTFNPQGMRLLTFKTFKSLIFPYFREKVDHFFAINEGSKNWLLKNFKISPFLVDIVPLAADHELFHPSSKIRKMVRRKIHLKNNEIIVVYSGKFLPSKDLHVLINAFGRILLGSNTGIKLLLIGNGPKYYMNYLKSQVKHFGISNHVIWVQPVPRTELPYYYNAADIAVWPGSPSISIIEAMSTGLPIILAKYPEQREDAYDTSYLLDYENGLSFSRGNVSELASCIIELASDDDLRKKMGERSRKFVVEKLNWRICTNKYLQIYQNIT